MKKGLVRFDKIQTLKTGITPLRPHFRILVTLYYTCHTF